MKRLPECISLCDLVTNAGQLEAGDRYMQESTVCFQIAADAFHLLVTGPQTQPLRGIGGNVYSNQQPTTSRVGPLGSSRLANGKLGTRASCSWRCVSQSRWES